MSDYTPKNIHVLIHMYMHGISTVIKFNAHF